MLPAFVSKLMKHPTYMPPDFITEAIWKKQRLNVVDLLFCHIWCMIQ